MIFDIESIASLMSAICLFIGSFLCISGGIGILRFPDFYTRMHAVGVTDTLAAGLILIGLMLQLPELIVVIKLMMILVLTLFINPTASHALAKAAVINGLLPILHRKEANKKENNYQESKSSNS